MIGIEAISVYIPPRRLSNRDLMGKFDVDSSFLEEKIGVVERAIKEDGQEASDMALKALELLLARTNLPRESIQAVVVVTQNPDTNLPHVSGLVHGRASLSDGCAAFDIGLGCSGYVYGLSILKSFLETNGLTRGILITADPYSKVIDPEDKNTVLLFGDAATATLMGPEPALTCEGFAFGTRGDLTGALACRDNTLRMNGREVFNFAATLIPKHVEGMLAKNQISKDAIDLFLFHQGSAFIVNTLAQRLKLDRSKTPISIRELGNTVSSSIPILLESAMADPKNKTLLLCGFGVGLSWASCLCRKTEK